MPAPETGLRIVPFQDGEQYEPDATATAPREVHSAADVPGLTLLEVLRALDCGPRGLSEAQAEERLARHGENAVAAYRPPSWARRFLASVRDPFTSVLLVLGVVSALVSSWATASVIAVLVLVSCVLRSSGEHRAEHSVALLREMVAATATVRRRAADGAPPHFREVPVELLVPGDVVRLGPGDVVPADLLLLESNDLTVRQSALTGESVPVPKSAAASAGAGSAALPDQPHLCFQGGSVATGGATGVVVATGSRTLLAGAAPQGPHARQQVVFDRSVGGVAWILIRFMLLTPPLVLIANAALSERGLETLPFAVAVAVGMTPEMLPVVVTAALARGATALAAGSEVIVKRLSALHDLGAMDILCTDKTGTLTQDRPSLVCALDPDGRSDPGVARWAAANSLWTLHLTDLPVPDPLDEAILAAAEAHLDHLLEMDGVAALPFDPARRTSCAVVARPEAPRVHTLVVKGAVENVLARCTTVRTAAGTAPLTSQARADALRRAGDLAGDGLRLLAVATAERPARLGPYTPADERELTFAGVVGLSDTPAPTADTALAALAAKGVTAKVLTGDHPATTAHVCRRLGLEPGEILTGEHLDALDDAALRERVEHVRVFARCTPEHKARVVAALRAGGHTVGYLGEGVNDLPALHAADVGICPRDAVAVARESAEVVLAAPGSKDLTAIDRALTVGRRATANIAAYLRITLSSNLGNVVAMLAAGLLLPYLPMLPSQVLVQNLCFDAAQLALAFDRPAPGSLRAPALLRPRALLGFITGYGVLNATSDLATFLVLLLAVPGGHGAVRESVFHAGWFTENLLTQALVTCLMRAGRGSGVVPWALRTAIVALAATGVVLPLSPLAPMLGMTAPPPLFYALLAVILVLYAFFLSRLVRPAPPADAGPAPDTADAVTWRGQAPDGDATTAPARDEARVADRSAASG